MFRSVWLWPIIIVTSAIGVSLVTFTGFEPHLRPLIVFWFLITCPGMAFVRLLGLKDIFAEWTLAIALSLCLDAIVALVLAYARLWLPQMGLLILVGLSIMGSTYQVLMAYEDKFDTLFANMLFRVKVFGVVTGLFLFAVLPLSWFLYSRLQSPAVSRFSEPLVFSWERLVGMVMSTRSAPPPTSHPETPSSDQAISGENVSTEPDKRISEQSPTPTVVVTPAVVATPTLSIIRNACEVPPPAGWVEYVVQPGDTYPSMARERGTGIYTIKLVNCMEGKTLRPGALLWLPPPR